jgi:hypothetical protein
MEGGADMEEPSQIAGRQVNRASVVAGRGYERRTNERLCVWCTPESREIIIRFWAEAEPEPEPEPDSSPIHSEDRPIVWERAQKLTRPDGEIRAGRVDRRRGSGGRERRSGL